MTARLLAALRQRTVLLLSGLLAWVSLFGNHFWSVDH